MKKKIMTHTYKIFGMTCNGCRSHVEETLKQVAGVTEVSVDLEKAEAVISMPSHIDTETLQKALQKHGGRHRVATPGEKPPHHHQTPVKAPKGTGTATFDCPMPC